MRRQSLLLHDNGLEKERRGRLSNFDFFAKLLAVHKWEETESDLRREKCRVLDVKVNHTVERGDFWGDEKRKRERCVFLL